MAAPVTLSRNGEIKFNCVGPASRFARKFTIPGPSWNVLRIACLLDGDRGGDTTLPNQAHMFFGLCAGTAAIYGDATPAHCVGTYWSAASSNANNTYGCPTKPAVNVAGALSLGTNLQALTYYHNQSATATGRHPLIVEITKGSPNYSFRMLGKGTNNFIETTPATLVGVMNMNTPVLANFTWVAAQTLAVDEGANGTLDSVCFYWNEANYNMEVSEIHVLKMS